MATCPRCGTALKDEYGMSQCPGCGAFCFIDMEGNAVVQSEEPAASLETPDPIENVIDAEAEEIPADSDFASNPEPSVDWQNAGAFGASDSTESSDFKPFDPFEHPVEPEPVFENETESEPDPEREHERENVASTPAFGPADDPLNLNDFANSEVSSAKDGPLLFRVLISGIDTREIRDSIREVLEDPRFAWDSNEIFSKVSKGHLEINGLSPVKASILVTRIKRLPVGIRWEQHAIAQGQP